MVAPAVAVPQTARQKAEAAWQYAIIRRALSARARDTLPLDETGARLIEAIVNPALAAHGYGPCVINLVGLTKEGAPIVAIALSYTERVP